MQQEYTQDEIDAFVKGQLSPEERSLFLQKMKEDPVLADAVVATRFQLDVANEIIRQETLAKMKAWDAEKNIPPEPPPPPENISTPDTRFWPIAAAAVLALAVAFFFIRPFYPEPVPPQPPAPQDSLGTPPPPPRPPNDPVSTAKTRPIAEAAAKVFGEVRAAEGFSSSSTRKGAAAKNSLDTLSRANAWMAEKQYAQAAQLLQAVPTGSEDYWQAQMYLGDVYFFEGKFAHAESTYLAAYQQGDLDSSLTFWRLAAAHCAAGNCAALKTLLEKLPPTASKQDQERANTLRKACR